MDRYVSFIPPHRNVLLTPVEAFDRQEIARNGSLERLSNVVDEHQDLAMGPGAPKVLPHKTISPPQDRIFFSGLWRG